MSGSEIAFCILLLLPLPFVAIAKQWRLFWVFVTFYVCFGIQEWMSVAQTGSSISQHFWILDTANPLQGWMVVGSMALMWAGLLIHFKVHKDRKK